MSTTMSAPPGADPMAGDPAPEEQAPDSDVLVTITSDGQGAYLVYSGDEPEEGQGDMSMDDTDAMGPADGAPASNAPEGQPASSIGAALKIAMDILQQAESAGPGGSADDQFSAGFTGSQAPTPAGGPPMAQKF